MVKKTKKIIKKIPGELHQHSFLAIFLGILAIFFSLVAVRNSVKAEDLNAVATPGTNISTETACAYKVGSWSTCTANGYQTRTVEKYPDGCRDIDNPPVAKQSCIPATVSCSITYSDWGTCYSGGYQTRTIKLKSPDGCVITTTPILRQNCTYQEITQATACAYNYSAWSDCGSTGYQTRTVTSKVPSGCYESAVPILRQSCAYTSSTSTSNTSSSTNDNSDDFESNESVSFSGNSITNTSEKTSTSTTPYFKFLNLSGGEVISGELKLQGTVERATSVELYLISLSSNSPKYLGLAKLGDNNVWEYVLDTTKQPNGSFYIRPKIKNAYGVYDGERRMLVILNANEEIEKAIIQSQDNVSSDDINKISNEWQEKYFKSAECVDMDVCGGDADPDQDGVNNNEEYRLGSNPINPDTDQDGFLDGDEIKNGFNPVKASPGDKSDKMVFESPKERGEIKSDIYKVEKVELVEMEKGKGLKLEGKALPNTYVTIYIYSDPVVLTVKTDADGSWSYVLDKGVEDGEHQVYVAVTDNTGKITAKSEAVAFVKTAQAANIIMPSEALASERAISPTKSWSSGGFYLILAISLGALSLAIATLGLVKHNLSKKEDIELIAKV